MTNHLMSGARPVLLKLDKCDLDAMRTGRESPIIHQAVDPFDQPARYRDIDADPLILIQPLVLSRQVHPSQSYGLLPLMNRYGKVSHRSV